MTLYRTFSFWFGLLLFMICQYTLLSLATWQYQRMHEKEALIATMQQQTEKTPLPLTVAEDGGISEWQPLQAQGRYDIARTVFLDNMRDKDGMWVGYRVVQPLLLEDGREILVDKGWLRRENLEDFRAQARAAQTEKPAVGPLETVHGVVRAYPVRKGWIGGPVTSTHADLLMFFEASVVPEKAPRLPFYLQLKEGTDSRLEASIGPLPDSIMHRDYMVTWLILSALCPLLFGALFYRAWRRQRA